MRLYLSDRGEHHGEGLAGTPLALSQQLNRVSVRRIAGQQKAAEAEKRARDKDIDEAYKKTISRMPDVKGQPADPWGNLRTPPSGK